MTIDQICEGLKSLSVELSGIAKDLSSDNVDGDYYGHVVAIDLVVEELTGIGEALEDLAEIGEALEDLPGIGKDLEGLTKF
jgi:hypothetical protein